MKIIGDLQIPFTIKITETIIEQHQYIQIKGMLYYNIFNISLKNLRPTSGIVSENTRYLYDGHELWSIQSIKGHVYFHNSIFKQLLKILNIRPLLNDVRATIYHQFKFIPTELRLFILSTLENNIKNECIKTNIYSLFTHAYFNEYENLKEICSLFQHNHPYIQDCKKVKQLFHNQVHYQSKVSKYLSQFNINFSFHQEYVYINNSRFHIDTCFQLFTHYETNCRLNKHEWYKHLKVHYNMCFIVQTLIGDVVDYDYNRLYFIQLSEKWVSYLKKKQLDIK